MARLQVNYVARMRFKLDRWNLSGFPGNTANRFLRALEVVKARMPPKVGAAVLRAAWNGWCTSRRFQQRGRCLFGCNAFIQEDSLEHYSCCSVGIHFLRRTLHFRQRVNKGHLLVLGANVGNLSEENYCKLALWSYVMYMAFNQLRTTAGADRSTEEVLGLMKQFLRDAVEGNEGATRLLSEGWRDDFSFDERRE